MARQRYIYDREKRELVPAELYQPKENKSAYIIQDSMDALIHPCTGTKIESKSAFRKITKAHGCTEMGNEKPTPQKPPSPLGGIREDLVRAAAAHGVNWE